MADPDRGASISSHIASIATRTQPQTDALLRSVRSHCWPSGPRDRTDAYALEWVRRWRPTRGSIPLLVCECAAGSCSVCN